MAEIKQILIAQKQIIQEKYHVSELGIFGSYVRGEDTEDSDVEILIDYDEAPTLIELIELEDYLSDLLDLKVDVVTKNSLKPPTKERILLEAVTV
ncbi:DNA polymerase beta [Planktothricoides sp. SR001]|nr:DNA polymerase beta [Planktothricoides sp. SR001]